MSFLLGTSYHIGNLKFFNIQTVFKNLFLYILQVLLQIEGVCSLS